MKPILRFAVVAAICLGNSFADIVLNDKLNSEIKSLTVIDLSMFTVTSGNVDVIGPGFYDFYPGNGNYLDLDGTGFTNGTSNATLMSKGSFGPGTYVLTFDLGNNAKGDNAVQISLGDSAPVTIASGGLPTSVFTPESLSFATSITGHLVFQQLGTPDNQGSVIDNVILSATPEPGTLGLMFAGLSGVMFAARRLRKS